ncbi:Hypothetical predicted protein [Olea europaea subsp. europaea]|uniref:Uncharacterized protein n=1 Tax=Olea europaea subsp. europaea TaxID=158383 RepID=A0A8S0PIE5_OLEEU|nr:Hypothetical predicted protein [Olea europaea subsp. europaea]
MAVGKVVDNILAKFEIPVVHTTRRVPSLNFMTWAEFCAAIVYIRSQILYILHIGFTITSNGKTVEFIVLMLLAFLQVKNNGIDVSSFITHSMTMYTAIISFLIYAFLAYGMNMRSENFHSKPPQYHFHIKPPQYPFHCMVFSGNMVVASLASIFFPDSIRPVLYVLCVLISGGELLYRIYQREEHIFMRHIRHFFNTPWMWSIRYFSMEQRDILPRFVIHNRHTHRSRFAGIYRRAAALLSYSPHTEKLEPYKEEETYK